MRSIILIFILLSMSFSFSPGDIVTLNFDQSKMILGKFGGPIRAQYDVVLISSECSGKWIVLWSDSLCFRSILKCSRGNAVVIVENRFVFPYQLNGGKKIKESPINSR